jgi:hypothetical protein
MRGNLPAGLGDKNGVGRCVRRDALMVSALRPGELGRLTVAGPVNLLVQPTWHGSGARCALRLAVRSHYFDAQSGG